MFTFAPQRRSDLLTVDDAFVRLSKIDDLTNDMVFDFQYVVKLNRALSAGGTLVRTTVLDALIVGVNTTAAASSPGARNNDAIVEGIVSNAATARALERARQRAIVCTSSVDLTSLISNVDPTGKTIGTRGSIRSVSAGELKRSNVERPVLVRTTSLAPITTQLSSSIVAERRRLMHAMVDDGIDPSIITEMTHRSITAYDSVLGLAARRRLDFEPLQAASLLQHSVLLTPGILGDQVTNSIPDDARVQILDVVDDDTVVVHSPATVMAARLKKGSFGGAVTVLHLLIEIIDPTTGLSIQTVTRSINIGTYVRFKRTALSAPRVSVGRSHGLGFGGNTGITVTSPDPSTTAYDVYRKPDVAGATYEYVTRINSVRGRGTMNVNTPMGGREVLRFIPVGRGGISSTQFTNVILSSRARTSAVRPTLVATSIETGVRLETFNVPYAVCSLAFAVKDLGRLPIVEVPINDVVTVDDDARLRGSVVIVDPNVIDGRTYEHVVYAINEAGIKQRLSSTTTTHRKLPSGRVDTKISDLSIASDGNVDVSFTVQSEINDTTLDTVRELLVQNDTIRYFEGDIAKQRKLLKRLVIHAVQRVDLTTGQRDDFGQLSGTTFSDAALRDKRAIEAPVKGHRYRYEVYVMVRSPETVLTDVIKDAVDPTTKKPYTFSPAKFQHPVALEKGIITSKPGLAFRFGLDEMTFGMLGLTSSFDVSIGTTDVSLSGASVQRFDPVTLVITWNINGDAEKIDHFLILKEVNNVRTLVSRSHALGGTSTFTSYVPFTARDTGELRYLIIPVTNDYDTLDAIYTNSIVLGET